MTATGRMVDAFRALDAIAPTTVAAERVRVLDGLVLGSTTVRARVGWPAATDDLTGVAAYDARLRKVSGAYVTAV